MEINLRRCFFHSIVPLRKKNTIFNFEESQLERFKLMLKTGYIYPGNQLKNIETDEFVNLYNGFSDCVYLSQHIMSELPCYGGSYRDGEFSAYLEHIVGNPAWVFGENLVNGKKIPNIGHSLSEEVCIQESIDLREAIAVMLPFETPVTKIRLFLQYHECKLLDDIDAEDIGEILKNRDELLKKAYEKIQKWQKELSNYGYDIPCIDSDGKELSIEKEKEYILEHEESIKRLIKK